MCIEIPFIDGISFTIFRYLCSIIMFPKDRMKSSRQGSGIIRAARDIAWAIVVGNAGSEWWPSGGSS
jgi:hypothetical protein